MKAANEALSIEKPSAVTFDTLAAAQELRKSGLEDRQAEAIVATISKAMSETVATKADLELQGAATRAEIVATSRDLEERGAEIKVDLESRLAEVKADLELQLAEVKADLELQLAEVKADLESQLAEVKADLESQLAEVKADLELQLAELKAGIELQLAELKAGIELQATETRTEIAALKQSMASLQDKIVIRIGALMVTMTFLLLAFGPFYIRWVMSLTTPQ